MKTSSEGICEMCGHHVANRQKAHILAEGKKGGSNLLMLCPSCHIMFDTHVKPKIHQALCELGVKDLPTSWKTSIYQQGVEASAQSRTQRKRSLAGKKAAQTRKRREAARKAAIARKKAKLLT